LTDTGLHGAPEFLEQCWQNQLAPVLGLSLERDQDQALVLAEGPQGYASLCGLASQAAQEPEAAFADLFSKPRPGLHLTSPSLNLLESLRAIMPRRCLYAELRWQPGWLGAEALARGFQVLATAPVHFLKPEDLSLHRLVRAIHLKRSLSRLADDECAPKQAWFQPPGKIAEAFAEMPQALASAEKLAQACRVEQSWFKVSFPGWASAAGQSPRQQLRALCEQGIPMRFGPERSLELNAAIAARLAKELSLIERKGFVEYFLVVRQIVLKSPRTCGRGSGAASLVAFLLGITQVDPLAHNLYFERFLNEGREDYPDLDVDFAWDERDQVQAWALQAFGQGHAALVANHVRYQPRMALRETARVFGLAPDETRRITSAFGWSDTLEPDAQELRPAGAAKPEKLAEPWGQVFSLASRLVDIPRLVSVHCGGIVITAGPLASHAPLQWAAKQLPGVEEEAAGFGPRTPLLQWDKDGAEAMGLVKIDLLGNRALAVVRDALQAVAAAGGPVVDEARFRPLDDPACRRLLKAGDTLGCFYIESPATRLTLKKAGRIDFETLVVISSIIRPAAHLYIDEWVRRLRGGPWVDVHPVLNRLFPDTFGIPVYQEHVNQMAEEVAGFSPAEADKLRKVLGKKSKKAVLADFKVRFMEGGRARGYGELALATFWDCILSFEGYSFCKPHSASYALVSYQCVWLRAHYPAEFMAAVLSNHGGFYHAWAYVSECRRMGLAVLGPDVNASGEGWSGAGKEVRVGLSQVGGLSQCCVERITEQRQGQGPYRSVEDFLARARPAHDEAQALIHSGALDGILAGLTRPQALWLARMAAKQPEASLGGLFDSVQQSLEPAPALPEFPAPALAEKKLQALGFLPKEHAFAARRREGLMQGYWPLRDLGQKAGQKVRFLGLCVTCKQVQTKHGAEMTFVSFEDDTALAEAVLFPQAYQRFGHLLDLDREPLIVEGVVKEEWGALNVEVGWVGMMK
jgi:DNA-directed DNA polymerase III PolC